MDSPAPAGFGSPCADFLGLVRQPLRGEAGGVGELREAIREQADNDGDRDQQTESPPIITPRQTRYKGVVEHLAAG